MEIKIIEGEKGPGDKKVLIRATSWTSPKMRDILTILDAWFKNEDLLYPPPALGRKMLLNAIFRVYERDDIGLTLDEIFKEFKI